MEGLNKARNPKQKYIIQKRERNRKKENEVTKKKILKEKRKNRKIKENKEKERTCSNADIKQ